MVSLKVSFLLKGVLGKGTLSLLFLFVIIAEALSRMVGKAAQEGLTGGFRVAGWTPLVTHLQYADETLIFCEANEDQIRNVKAIHLCFEAVSGLKISFFKSMPIGIRVGDSHLHQYAGVLGCKVGSFPTLYLGLPLCLLERVERKMSLWKAKYLC